MASVELPTLLLTVLNRQLGFWSYKRIHVMCVILSPHHPNNHLQEELTVWATCCMKRYLCSLRCQPGLRYLNLQRSTDTFHYTWWKSFPTHLPCYLFYKTLPHSLLPPNWRVAVYFFAFFFFCETFICLRCCPFLYSFSSFVILFLFCFVIIRPAFGTTH